MKYFEKQIWTMNLKFIWNKKKLITKRSNYNPIESTNLTDFPELKSR